MPETALRHLLGLARALDAGVGEGDDDVCGFFLHDRRPGSGSIDEVVGMSNAARY